MLSVNQILCHIKRACVFSTDKRACVFSTDKTDSVASNHVGCFVLSSFHFGGITLITPMYVV
jgi:hypothetical protein